MLKNFLKTIGNHVTRKSKSTPVNSLANQEMERTAENGVGDSEKALQEKRRLDNLYGCTEDGRLCSALIFMNMNEVGAQFTKSEKKYVLKDIDKLHEKISIMQFINAWAGTGKSEWECMMGYLVMYPVRKAWSEGQNEADITRLFEVTLLAHPTGRADEEIRDFNGTPYRVLTQEKINEKVMRFFTVQEETESKIYLTLNIE